MELVKNNTLETQVSKKVQDIQDWLRDPGSALTRG
jgi:hypothetical protein